MDIWGNEPDFANIMSDTAAGMGLQNYRDLFREALSLKPGIVVEIGPARGAGTVILGLAGKQNPNIEKIITIDAFQNSRSLKTFDNAEENISDLRRNLEKYHCEEKVTIMIAGQEDWELIRNSQISMLVIDADGGLDRDFSNYFNLLIPEATVFVDDCELKLNSHAKSHYSRERYGYSEDPVAEAREFITKISPLGKEYITKCFIEYMIRNGFLEQTGICGKTVTLRKKADAPSFTDNDRKNMEKIRDHMKQKLLEIRRETLKIVKEAEPILSQICRYTGYEEAVLLKGELFPRTKEIRYYPICGIRNDGKSVKAVSKIFEKELEKPADPDCKCFIFRTGRKSFNKHALMLRGDENIKTRKKNLPLLMKFRLWLSIMNIEKQTARYLDTLELPLFL